jgi:hypothetical protein
VRQALASPATTTDAATEVIDVPVVAEGPYDESAYYGASARYSALHTCNTWAAEALRAAGLDVRTRFVVFAGQTWNQARKAQKRAHIRITTSLCPARPASPEGVLAPTPVNFNRREADCRSDRPPSSSIPAGLLPWSSAGEAGSSC